MHVWHVYSELNVPIRDLKPFLHIDSETSVNQIMFSYLLSTFILNFPTTLLPSYMLKLKCLLFLM